MDVGLPLIKPSIYKLVKSTSTLAWLGVLRTQGPRQFYYYSSIPSRLGLERGSDTYLRCTAMIVDC